MVDGIKGADNDIDKYKLVFIGCNRGKFNFSIFRMPVDFLSAIYNGEMEEEIEELKGYRPENAEREEISEVLMQANDMLEYRKKLIETFRDGTFLSEH